MQVDRDTHSSHYLPFNKVPEAKIQTLILITMECQQKCILKLQKIYHIIAPYPRTPAPPFSS